jgi:hypothetical protein
LHKITSQFRTQYSHQAQIKLKLKNSAGVRLKAASVYKLSSGADLIHGCLRKLTNSKMMQTTDVAAY